MVVGSVMALPYHALIESSCVVMIKTEFTMQIQLENHIGSIDAVCVSKRAEE